MTAVIYTLWKCWKNIYWHLVFSWSFLLITDLSLLNWLKLKPTAPKHDARRGSIPKEGFLSHCRPLLQGAAAKLLRQTRHVWAADGSGPACPASNPTCRNLAVPNCADVIWHIWLLNERCFRTQWAVPFLTMLQITEGMPEPRNLSDASAIRSRSCAICQKQSDLLQNTYFMLWVSQLQCIRFPHGKKSDSACILCLKQSRIEGLHKLPQTFQQPSTSVGFSDSNTCNSQTTSTVKFAWHVSCSVSSTNTNSHTSN